MQNLLVENKDKNFALEIGSDDTFAMNKAMFDYLEVAISEHGIDHIYYYSGECEPNDAFHVWAKCNDFAYPNFAFIEMALLRVVTVGVLDNVAVELFKIGNRKYR